MRAVITVIGKDMVGILARVSTICAESGVNVIEVTQSVMQDLFVMIMMVDISKSSIPFSELSDRRRRPSTPCTKTFSTPCTEFKNPRDFSERNRENHD